MKSIISKTMTLLVICATAFSFAPKPGGEGFEILLNEKVMVQRYGNDLNEVQSLQLNHASASDKLTIKYYHCGKVGKNRVITFKDVDNNIIKEFHYPDANNPVAVMTLKVQDIMNLKKGNTTLRLYYSSSELTSGRMLVSINSGSANRTMP